MNGRCEGYIRRLKRSVRTLLLAHVAPVSEWPWAMRHVAARMQAIALTQIGVPVPSLLPWKARLALRQRSWAAQDAWDSRVVMATVLCPSSAVNGGHLVRTDTGALVHTDSLVEVADTVELSEYVPSAPPTRVSKSEK